MTDPYALWDAAYVLGLVERRAPRVRGAPVRMRRMPFCGGRTQRYARPAQTVQPRRGRVHRRRPSRTPPAHLLDDLLAEVSRRRTRTRRRAWMLAASAAAAVIAALLLVLRPGPAEPPAGEFHRDRRADLAQHDSGGSLIAGGRRCCHRPRLGHPHRDDLYLSPESRPPTTPVTSWRCSPSAVTASRTSWRAGSPGTARPSHRAAAPRCPPTRSPQFDRGGRHRDVLLQRSLLNHVLALTGHLCADGPAAPPSRRNTSRYAYLRRPSVRGPWAVPDGGAGLFDLPEAPIRWSSGRRPSGVRA